MKPILRFFWFWKLSENLNHKFFDFYIFIIYQNRRLFENQITTQHWKWPNTKVCSLFQIWEHNSNQTGKATLEMIQY